jgi:SNF2 family DNA or RNA helicase
VEMTPAQTKAYDQMREDMVAGVRGGTVAVPNALVRTGRLMALASAYGEVVGPEGSEEFRMATPSNKITAFVDDWTEGDFPGSTVVATYSRQLLILLATTLREAGHGQFAMIHGEVPEADRGKEVLRFQDGEVDLFLMTFGVGGTGITLTAARRMVLLQRSWSAVEMKQAVDRVHRIGSERHRSVEVVDYVSPGTLELAQFGRLADKEAALQEIVRDADALDRMLRGE